MVEVTADATTLYSITVTEQNETQGIGTVACEQLPDAMVAANSYNVDGIAGATVTSNALKEAVQAALESAGLTAAAQAAEDGAKVIVVEKMPIVGGNSLKATGGMNAAGTQYQESLGITDSGVNEFIEDTMNGGHQINDRSLVAEMAEQSSDAIDWLTSIGAPLPKVAATGGTTHKYLHEPEDGSAVGSYLVDKLNAQAEKLGVQILLNTTVYQENGLLVSESVRSMGGILVNAEGKRFCNDMSTRDAVSNAELEQLGAYAYIIFDQRIVNDLKSCEKYIKNGLTVSSDSYEGLAKEMGLEGEAASNFVETMNTWNASVAAGEDAEFGRIAGKNAAAYAAQ